jgi:hypothetical protein
LIDFNFKKLNDKRTFKILITFHFKWDKMENSLCVTSWNNGIKTKPAEMGAMLEKRPTNKPMTGMIHMSGCSDS